MNQDVLEIAKKKMQNGTNSWSTAIIAGLVGLVPSFGGLFSSTIGQVMNDFQEKKRQEFLNVILSDEQMITTEMVSDVEFIMNFAKTLDVVNRLASNDKVVYLGNLLKNSYFTTDKINNCEYEEYLALLSELSYREIFILIEYDRRCSNLPQNEEIRFSVFNSVQDIFITEMSSKFSCSRGEIADIMRRLESKGLCVFQTAHGYGESSSMLANGVVTDYFKKLSERII